MIVKSTQITYLNCGDIWDNNYLLNVANSIAECNQNNRNIDLVCTSFEDDDSNYVQNIKSSYTVHKLHLCYKNNVLWSNDDTDFTFFNKLTNQFNVAMFKLNKGTQ